MWALPGAPPLVVNRHSPWEVGLLHAGPEVVGPEPLGGWRGRPDGAGCALLYTATYLQVQGGDRDGRVEHTLLGGLVTCLLYTSPSPRDATLSRMPSSA